MNARLSRRAIAGMLSLTVLPWPAMAAPDASLGAGMASAQALLQDLRIRKPEAANQAAAALFRKGEDQSEDAQAQDVQDLAVAPVSDVQGPPGSRPPGSQQPPGSRPPGSQPPGSQPPGSQPPSRGGGDDSAPSNQTPPPSRPAPVVNVTGTPPPNFWNTLDWGSAPLWNNPLVDFGQDRFTVDPNDQDHGRLVTRWFLDPIPYVETNRYPDSKSVERTGSYQPADVTQTLVVAEEVVSYYRYYRAVYDVAWVQDFYGGRYEAYFKRWDAARGVYDRRPGRGIRRDVTVHFDMGGRQVLPWEKESFALSFDGRQVGVSAQRQSYRYQEVSNDGYTVVLQAGPKVLTDADPNGVKLEVVPAAGKGGFTFKLTDWWTDFYDKNPGETLELAVEIDDNGFWKKTLYEIGRRSPDRYVTFQQKDLQKGRANVFDIFGPWKNPKLAPAPGRSFRVDWSFRRVGSSVSNNDWIDGQRFNVQF